MYFFLSELQIYILKFREKSQNCEFILSFIYGSLFPPQNKKKVIAIPPQKSVNCKKTSLFPTRNQ